MNELLRREIEHCLPPSLVLRQPEAMAPALEALLTREALEAFYLEVSNPLLKGWLSRLLRHLGEEATSKEEPLPVSTAFPELLGSAECAELAGVSVATLANWKLRFQDFPKPRVQLRCGPVFSKDEVHAWLKLHGKL